MSDSEDTTGAPEANATQGGDGARRPVRIFSQYAKDLSFENFMPPGSGLPADAKVEIQAKVDVTATHLKDRRFEVALHVEVEAKTGSEKIYLIELVYAGIVEVGEVAEEHVEPILFIEVPRFLYPFTRPIIANVARDGGFQGLIGETIDFVDMFKRRMAARKQQAEDVTKDKSEEKTQEKSGEKPPS